MRAIRDFVLLPEGEPIAEVLLAAFLLNHAPAREVNIWLVLVAPQGEAKTELINLIKDHPSVWKLPDRLSQGYFFSARTMGQSALARLDAAGQRYRMLLMSDMATLTDGIAYQYQGDIYTQLLSIHDGHYKAEAGLNSQTLEYGPKAADERLGFLGAATEAFYNFFGRSHRLGTRFLLYYMDPGRHRHWTDTSDLEEISRRQPNQAAMREEARVAVQSFLDAAIPELRDFGQVTMPTAADARIAAGSRFVSRIMGDGRTQDSGTRRSLRVRELVRMFAFMQGRFDVRDSDVDLGLRVVFSQLNPEVHRAIAFGLAHRSAPWDMEELLASLGGTRRVFAPVLQHLVDVGILVLRRAGRDAKGRPGRGYALSGDAMGVAAKFDAGGSLFAVERRPEPAQSRW